jgi:hypothetical protein
LFGTYIDELSELAACFGSDATPGGIKFQFMTKIKDDVKAIRAARASGVDCKDIALPSLSTKGGSGAISILS